MAIDLTKIEKAPELTDEEQEKARSTCQHTFAVAENDDELLCYTCGMNALDYIEKLEEKACCMGVFCAEHDTVHGAEAEQLRKVLEAIEGELVGARVTVDGADYVNADDIRCLITDIDACDSLAFVEKYKDEKLEGMSASLKFANSVLAEKDRRIKELEERINTIVHTASKR